MSHDSHNVAQSRVATRRDRLRTDSFCRPVAICMECRLAVCLIGKEAVATGRDPTLGAFATRPYVRLRPSPRRHPLLGEGRGEAAI